MKPFSKFLGKSRSVVLLLLTAAGIMLGVAGTLRAQANDFHTELTIAEIMDAMVMREADVIWQAVEFRSTEDGSIMVGPETEEGWTEVRHAAMALAEAANNLVIPGRHSDSPGAEVVEGELPPAEIDALIAQQRGAWVGFAEAMRSTAMQAVAAIDERDADKILDVGGSLDQVCESCHLVFWYPNQ